MVYRPKNHSAEEPTPQAETTMVYQPKKVVKEEQSKPAEAAKETTKEVVQPAEEPLASIKPEPEATHTKDKKKSKKADKGEKLGKENSNVLMNSKSHESESQSAHGTRIEVEQL